jgi:O-antigen ligase
LSFLKETLISPAGTWPDRLLLAGFGALFFFLPWATSGVSVAGGLALAVWVLSGKCRQQRWWQETWAKPVLFFLLLPWVALIWSPDLAEGLDWASKSYVWLLTFAAAGLTGTAAQWRFLLGCFLAGLAFVALVSLAQYLALLPEGPQIPSLRHANRITGSLFLVWGGALLVFPWKDSPGFSHLALRVGLILLFLVCLSLTGGRAGYVAFLVLLPVIFLRLWGRRVVFILPALVLAGGLMFATPVVQQRLHETFGDIKAYREGNPNTSVGLRLVMWEGAIITFASHPFLGAGTGGYKSEMAQISFPGLAPEFRGINDPHNSFLFVAANYGLVGLFSLAWLLWAYFHPARIFGPSPASWAVLSFGIVLMTGSLTGTEIMSFHSGNLWALLMGLRTTAPDPARETRK